MGCAGSKREASAVNSCETLWFEGGSSTSSCLYFVGALSELDRVQAHGSLRVVGGAMAGSIIACLVALRLSAVEIFRFLVGIQYSESKDTPFPWNSPLSFSSIGTVSYGGNASQNKESSVYVALGEICAERLANRDVTFHQLHHATQIDLFMSAYNLKSGKEIIFSRDSTPDVPIRLAARAALGFPPYVGPLRFDNDFIISSSFHSAVVTSLRKTLMKKRKSLGLLVSAPRIQELNGPDEYVSDLALILSSSNSEIPVDNLVVLAVETECRAGTNLDDQLRRSTLEKGRTSMLTFLNLKYGEPRSDVSPNDRENQKRSPRPGALEIELPLSLDRNSSETNSPVSNNRSDISPHINPSSSQPPLRSNVRLPPRHPVGSDGANTTSLSIDVSEVPLTRAPENLVGRSPISSNSSSGIGSSSNGGSYFDHSPARKPVFKYSGVKSLSPKQLVIDSASSKGGEIHVDLPIFASPLKQ